jgi:hypothetical protein
MSNPQRARAAPPSGGQQRHGSAPPSGGQQPPSSGRQPPSGGQQRHGSAPPSSGWVTRNWKRAALGVLALFVVISVGRSVLPALGIKAPGGGGPAGNPTGKSTQAKGLPKPAATLGGVQVLGGGGPLITLNPGLVRPSTPVTVTGSGFDAGAKVDVLLGAASGSKSNKATPVATATAGKDGSIAATFKFPTQATAVGTTQEITAQQRGGNKVAKAEAAMTGGAAGEAKLSAVVGKPGDTVSLSVSGFAPGEDLNVYWGRISGPPSATLKADSSGSLSKAPIRVGVGAVGTTSLVIVGGKSGAAASLPFQILRLYPSVAMKPYAVKAAQPIGFAGKGFDPGERVLVHLNSAAGQPVMALPTDQGGGFSASGIVVPFELTGRQTLVFIGEQSRASVSSGFMVLPYQPIVRASTYGAAPGTSVTFYATGFAPNEAVHVFVGGGKGGGGELIAAFRVDAKGRIGAGGSYMIPGDAQNSVTFNLVGTRSNASATTSVKVDNSGGAVDVPPQPKYSLPPDLQK